MKKMKNQIILFFALSMLLSCSKDNNDSNNEDSAKTNFGYYLGMPRYEFEYVTGAYLLDKTLKPHWSKEKDQYYLDDHVYGKYESGKPGDYNYILFYGEITFNLPSDKLASAILTFRHEGTRYGHESKKLRNEEAESIIVLVRKYLDDYGIKAKLSIVPYTKEFEDEEEEDWFEIIGYLEL